MNFKTLEEAGWQIDQQSPLEISRKDDPLSKASGVAVEMIYNQMMQSKYSKTHFGTFAVLLHVLLEILEAQKNSDVPNPQVYITTEEIQKAAPEFQRFSNDEMFYLLSNVVEIAGLGTKRWGYTVLTEPDYCPKRCFRVPELKDLVMTLRKLYRGEYDYHYVEKD